MPRPFLRPLLIGLCAVCLSGPCQAAVLYTFNYIAISGPIKSFDFSVKSSDFLTDGSSPAFDPFIVNDGLNAWFFTQDLVSVVNPTGLNYGCFVFGTSGAQLGGPPPLFGPCSFAVGGPGVNQAAFEFIMT